VPGVKCGDLGPKIGYNSKDNGWATFNQVRIPRTDMLMAFCSLDKEGEFSVNGDLRVLYTTMMSIRNLIIIGAGQQTMLPIKLGLRYALVRRQFSTIKGQKIERPIFDYQTHLHIFGPLLARSLSI
jgi:acyl-CoA oxidase